MPSSHLRAWRKWAGEAQCALTFLGSLRVSSSLWACKPSFCYSGFLSYRKSSSQQLSSEGSMPCTYFYDFLDFLFLPVYPVLFQAQHTQVGSVYIGNASGKTRVAVRVGLMMAQVTVLSFWKVHCLLLCCFCEMWNGPCEHFRWPEFLKSLCNNLWCLPLNIFKKWWFFSLLISAILRNYIQWVFYK